jgi:hypothetical protein
VLGNCRGFLGVLSDEYTEGLPLKQLRLKDCKLLDEQGRLAEALAQLPDLDHLRIDAPSSDFAEGWWCGEVYRGAADKLTFLELSADS